MDTRKFIITIAIIITSLSLTGQIPKTSLFDLLEDPFETNDISNENPEKVNEMKT